MELNPYQLEQLVIGMILRYPADAPNAIFPQLSYNRFIYGMSGKLGSQDHQVIMQKIIQVSQVQKKAPFPVDVKPYLSTDMQQYLDALVDMVPGRFRVYEYNHSSMQTWAEKVDRNGYVYYLASKSRQLGNIAESEEAFIAYTSGMKDVDVDEWANKTLAEFRGPIRTDTSNYIHIGQQVPYVIDEWERLRRGEQTILLPGGIPALANNGLFPVGKYAIVHGMSGGGKSAFVHATDLGIAMGLLLNGIKGCVTINSLEMSYGELISRFAAMLGGVDTTKLMLDPVNMRQEDFERLKYWAELLSFLPIYVDESNIISVNALEYRLNSLHLTETGPIWRLSSDYIELFDDADADNMEQKLAHVSREHFRLSRLLGASVVLIAQSTITDIKHQLAGFMGTRHSKAITQSADIQVEVYNPIALTANGLTYTLPPGVTNDQQMWLQIQKYRNGGFTGWLALNWTPEYTRISDPSMDTLGGSDIMFSHQNEVEKLLYKSRAQVVKAQDTPIGDFLS